MAVDTFERLQALKDRVEALLEEQSARDEKCATELAKMEIELALASALAALRAAATDCKHERVRAQVKGAREQISKVLAG